jgi:hypothetical protein
VTRTDAAGAAALAAIAVVYVAYSLTHLGGLRWNFDEGITVHKAWHLLEGVPLYTAIWSDQPPGQTVVVALAFRLLGVSVAAARTVTVWHGLVGILGTAWAAVEILRAQSARRGALWLGGVGAAAVLVVAPNFLWAARAAMLGINTFSLATAAVAAVLTYARTGRRAWLALAGLLLGASLWEKLQMVYLGPLFGAVVLAVGHRRRTGGAGRGGGPAALGASIRSTALDLTVLAVASLGPLALSFAAFEPSAMAAQALGSYFDTRAAYEVDWRANAELLRIWLLTDNRGLAALAAAGLLAALRRPGIVVVAAAAWPALTVATAMQHAPLWLEDHFEPFLFALAAWSGAAMGAGVMAAGDLKAWLAGRRPDRAARARLPARAAVVVAATAAAGVVAVSALPHVLAVDRQLSRARDYENDGRLLSDADWVEHDRGEAVMRAAAEVLRAHSTDDEPVIIDDQMIAFVAGRHVPPELAALSSRRIRIRAISGAELRAITARYRPPIVWLWKGQLSHFESYPAWLAAHYAPGPSLEGHPSYLLPEGAILADRESSEAPAP